MTRIIWALVLFLNIPALSQTVVTNGSSTNWNLSTSWTPNQAVPPGTSGNLVSQNISVRVSHNMVLGTDLSVASGTFIFGWNGSSVTNTNVNDVEGGAYYKLNLVKTQGTHTPLAGILDIKSGTTNNFEAGADMNKTNLIIRSGAKLILGPLKCRVCDPLDAAYDAAMCATTAYDDCRQRRLFLYGDSQFTIETGGEVIVYGNVENKSNPGFISLNGVLRVIGSYTATTGNADIIQNVPGVGDITTTGSMTSTGNSTIFGSSVNCQSNCSGLSYACSEVMSSWTISPFGTQAYCTSLGQTVSVSPSITLVQNKATSAMYQWESSTDAINYSPITGETLTSYTKSGSLSQTTYYRVNVKAFNGLTQVCNSFSVPVSLLPQANRWIGGSTNNNWNRVQNWCNGVPTSSEDVQFPAGSSVVVLNGETGNVRNLILSGTSNAIPGAVLSVELGGKLNVYGNTTLLPDTYTPAPINTNCAKLLNSGEISFYGGTLSSPALITNIGRFINSSGSHNYVYGNVQFADNIGHTFDFEEEFNHLIIKSGGRFKLVEDEDYDISGDIDVETGGEWVYAANTLHFHQGADQYLNVPNGNFYNLVVEKTTGTLSFNAPLNLLGRLSPNSATLINTNDNLTIKSTGISTVEDGSVGPVFPGASIAGNVKVERFVDAGGNKYRYFSTPVKNFSVYELRNTWWIYAKGGDFWYWNEPINKWSPFYKWEYMQTGKGYIIWDWAGETTKTILYRGQLHTGSFTYQTTKTTYGPEITVWYPNPPGYFSGWNLIGNPYASAIVVDGNPANWTMNGFYPYVSIRLSNTGTNQFVYWNWSDNTGDISSGIISTGQAFWLRAIDNTASVTIHESAKLPNPEIQFGRLWRKATSKQLVVGIRSADVDDRVFIKQNDEAFGIQERYFDMGNVCDKVSNGIFIVDYEPLTMKAFKIVPNSVPLQVYSDSDGEIEFYFSDENYMDEIFYLYDSKYGITVQATSSEKYRTRVKPNEFSRFFLVREPVAEKKFVGFRVYQESGDIRVVTNQENSFASIHDSNGREIDRKSFDIEASFSTPEYRTGIYIVRIWVAGIHIAEKIAIKN